MIIGRMGIPLPIDRGFWMLWYTRGDGIGILLPRDSGFRMLFHPRGEGIVIIRVCYSIMPSAWVVGEAKA